MTTDISTDRLCLRVVTPQDATKVTEIVSDPRIYRMVARISPNQTLAQTLAWIASHDTGRATDTDHVYAITQNGELIGMTGAHRAAPQLPFEVGYWLSPDHWGKGLVTEATDAVMEWLQTRGQRGFVSGYFADNPASGRVLDKLGFMKADRRPVFCLGRGEEVEHYDMAHVA